MFWALAMCGAKGCPSSEHDELMALVKRLQRQVEQLTAANEQLRKQPVELQRGGKRQAAPFSKGRPTSTPKRPGRKPGKGMFNYRRLPSPDEVTEPVVEVAVSGDTCPRCGGGLEHEGVGVAYVTDIPPIPRPRVTAYRVRICRRRSCGRQVRGRHPDVGPDQYGASAHRVERRLMAAAHVLDYGVGVPVRKVPSVLRALTEVEVSQGGDHPKRAATSKRCSGECLPQAAWRGEYQCGRTHRRHGIAGGRQDCISDGIRDGPSHGVPGSCSSR